MEPEGSLLQWQVPATCPYPQPTSIQATPLYATSWISILILFSHLRHCLPSCLFPSGFPTKSLYMPLNTPYVLHAPSISFFSILSLVKIWVTRTADNAPHHVVFSTSLSKAQIFSSTLFSQIPSLYVLPPCDRPSFTPIRNKSHNENCVNFHL